MTPVSEKRVENAKDQFRKPGGPSQKAGRHESENEECASPRARLGSQKTAKKRSKPKPSAPQASLPTTGRSAHFLVGGVSLKEHSAGAGQESVAKRLWLKDCNDCLTLACN